MSTWQKVGCGVVCIALFIGAILGIVFYATSGITDTADDFFAATNAGDYETASTYTSQRVQQMDKAEGLKRFIERSGLENVTDTSWSNRSVSGSTGELTGTVTTGSGGTIPLTILFVSENDEWKIDGFDIRDGGISSAPAASEPMKTPSVEDQKDLIFFATAGFVNGLGEEGFGSWKSRWVDGATDEFLEQNFSALRPAQSDIRRLVTQDPQWEPATSLNDEGYLQLEGTYEQGGQVMRFKYEFHDQGDGVPKLVGASYGLDEN